MVHDASVLVGEGETQDLAEVGRQVIFFHYSPLFDPSMHNFGSLLLEIANLD